MQNYMSVMKWSSSFIIFAIFVLVSAQSEAKTALFKTQGIMEETCPEIAEELDLGGDPSDDKPPGICVPRKTTRPEVTY
eukprot:TCALIF_06730-PA protein Name:"Protein of unknown function" AED:0.53 eAED:0.53 QI:0/0/0/0.33/1/1/3/0/78